MHTSKRTALLLMVALWMALANRGVQAAHVCEDVCTGASCDAECWLTQFDFDNNYPSTTCGDQGYSCCGDGVCDSGTEYCGGCQADCNDADSPSCDNFCTWSFQCGSGEVCNPSHQCVVPAPNNAGTGTECSNKNDCNAPDACMSSGECTIPHTDECDDGTACSNSEECQSNFGPNVFCDPGNGRCMYTLQPGCPL